MAFCQFAFFFVFFWPCWVATAAFRTPSCPINENAAKSGNITSVQLSVYDCAEVNRTPIKCLVQPSLVVTLRKGETVNMDNNIHGYALMAKFFGDKVCMSYRSRSIVKILGGKPVRGKPDCQVLCFRDEETTNTETDTFCDDNNRCMDEKQMLRFVVDKVSKQPTGKKTSSSSDCLHGNSSRTKTTFVFSFVIGYLILNRTQR